MPRVSLQLLLALALVLAASYYWQPRTGRQPDPETSARRQQLPQTYLYSTRTWAYTEDGVLSNILEADRAEHFSRDDESILQAPRFYAHNKDDKTWSASARKGRFRHEAQKLYLDDDVYLSHDQTGARLTTSHMIIDVQTRLAASPRPVTITQGEHRTVADGMMANLEEEQIVLAKNVESIYVIPSN